MSDENKALNAAESQGKGQMRSLLLGGIIPVVLFTLIEEYYGTVAGLIAGMIFGVGEIAYEYHKNKRVEKITLFGNGMLLILGGVSLFTSEGIWFKLQPALLELLMGGILIGSCLIGKPLLVVLSEKQGAFQNIPEPMRDLMKKGFMGMTIRIGIFFLLHAVLATWAALYWSTRAWAILKGVGFTGSLIGYMVIEGVLLRKRVAKAHAEQRQS